jgi:hypothetical protein
LFWFKTARGVLAIHDSILQKENPGGPLLHETSTAPSRLTRPRLSEVRIGTVKIKHTLLIWILLLTGCVAHGPVDSPEFPTLIARAIPAGDGEVRIYGPAEWIPNRRGFATERDLSVPSDFLNGVLAITDGSLVFLQWEPNLDRFDAVKRLAFPDIATVTLDKFGLNRRLVVRKNDLSYDSFGFLRGAIADTDKTEAAYELLKPRFKE